MQRLEEAKKPKDLNDEDKNDVAFLPDEIGTKYLIDVHFILFYFFT